MNMNRDRAAEIYASPNMVDVTYNGRPIYIENINPSKDMASVHYLNQPGYTQEVWLTQLVETK
jgi:small acid-soluble spore protein H (minor)